jgi:hypothetical protein
MSYTKTIRTFLSSKVGTQIESTPGPIEAGSWVLCPKEVTADAGAKWFWFTIYTRYLMYKVACQKLGTGQQVWRCWRGDNFSEGMFETFENLLRGVQLDVVQ